MAAKYGKSVGATDANGVRGLVPDVRFFGDGDTFKLICKAWSDAEGWMKSTKAAEIPGVGCIVQVTTQQEGKDGSYSIAEAVTFVPGVTIFEDKDEAGKVIGRRLEKL